MSKGFFEVFPNLPWKEELRPVFQDVVVEKVSLNKEHRRLKVYARSPHLIHARKTASAEDILRTSLLPGDSSEVHIILDFCLREVPPFQELFSEYRDSFEWELKKNDLLLYELYHTAKLIFTEEDGLLLKIPDSLLARELAEELILLLKRVAEERLHIRSEITYELTEAKGRIERSSVETVTVSLRAEKKPEPKEEVPAEEKPAPRAKKGKKKNPDVLYGRDFDEESVPIESLVSMQDAVVVRGKVLSVTVRELKKGDKVICIFRLTDKTDTIEGKVFLPKEEGAAFGKAIEDAGFLKVKGLPQVDLFTKELSLSGIIGIKKQENFFTSRMDNAKVKRVELHLHTKMSDMDAVSDIKDIIAQAVSWGHKALAITDHGVVQAFTEGFHALPKGKDFKLIYGVEGYLADDADCPLGEQEIHDRKELKKYRPRHIILLAKNDIGRVNLYRLISMSHLKYFYRKPLIPKSELSRLREGLIIGSACEAGELYQAILNHESAERIHKIAGFYDYLEIQPVGNNRFLIGNENFDIENEEDLRAINRRIVELAEELHKPVVATSDMHFLNPEDEIYRTIIQSGNGYEDAENQPPLFLHTTEEMLEEFAYLGADKAYEIVVENTNRIADMCERIDPVRPDKCPPVIENSDVTLRQICETRAREIYGDPLPPVVKARLDRELSSIIGNGYAVMYIIAQKLVWKSNEDGYLVGSRGSVGSSLAATMAGITEVNPLHAHYLCPNCHYSDFDSEEVKAFAGRSGCDMPDRLCPKCGTKLKKDGFDIPFETFLGFKGNKEPDIDLNFSGDYQSKAHAYTEVIFGRGQTYRAGTITGVAEKTAFGYVKNYYEDRGIEKRKCEIERLLLGCVGIRKSTGQHPGGIIVLPVGEEIDSFTPIQKPANKEDADSITTHFDYHSIEHNLLKLDILGHDDPTMIKCLEELTGINAREIPLDDPKVMSLFKNTEALGIEPSDIGGVKLGALGIPEFGTDFAMEMLIDTKPQEFSDLIRIAGLAHGTDVWLGNAQELIRSGKATISTAICTRDDIMTYLISKGIESETAFKIMENVRKGKVAKGKCPEWEEWKAELLSHDVPDWYIWSCERIKYMFPKAHAAAYVMMAWRIAWCKVYYPLAYYAAYFSIRADAFSYELMCQGEETLKAALKDFRSREDKLSAKEKDTLYVLRIVEEMYARGFSFTPIDLYQANPRFFKIVDGKIMPSFSSIDKMGSEAAASVAFALKDGPFLSRQDFKNRTKVTQTVIDRMHEMGIFQDLPETNQMSLMDFL
ncbi:MAG: PolC-type DNA polymerase III [Lachnospiraceae bacterium]|nr:PolC-type DNA polymerase III [Lachnospiraceae bacterium]